MTTFTVQTLDRAGHVLTVIYSGSSMRRSRALADRAMVRAYDAREQRIGGVRTVIDAPGRRTTISHEITGESA